MKKMRSGMITGIALVIMLVLTLTGQALVSPVVAQNPVTRISNALITTLRVLGTSTMEDATVSDDLTVGDDLTVLDAATISGAATVTGDATLGADLRFTAAIPITVTQDATLTPTGTYQPITAGGNVQFATITVGAAGTDLYIINASNTTITISDTATNKLTGNIALGQYDSLHLLSDGTSWVQLSTSNN